MHSWCSIVQTKTNSRKEKVKEKRSSNSPFLDSQHILKTRWESKKAWKPDFPPLFSIHEMVFCCSVLCPKCSMIHVLCTVWFSLLSDIAGEDLKAEKVFSKRLEHGWGLSVSLLGSLTSTSYIHSAETLLGLFTLALKHSTDSLCDLAPDAHGQLPLQAPPIFIFKPWGQTMETFLHWPHSCLPSSPACLL